MDGSVDGCSELESNLMVAGALLQRLVSERCETDDGDWTWQSVSMRLRGVVRGLEPMGYWPGITDEELAVFERARESMEQLVSQVERAEAEARHGR